MKLDKALAWFFWAWIALLVLKDIVVIVGFALVSRDFWQDLPPATTTVLGHYNPLNVPRFLASLVWLSPAIGVLIWRKARQKRLATGQEPGST